ncbi:hypothetical protein HPT25_28055 [Bacillus sp. BRMEA1]|uniref:hypothetical protein n=1 Tax=Neobacillus endophyticus TaxID=2738405 RepID=UPI001565C4C7|nr:hypothetical protein [Neobacillus endophyticus]NRD81149.1 hypothetical protein [Neobacillus endophyticus]
MYCVIQKVTNKKPNQYGHYKELTVSSTSFGIAGQPLKTKYSYRYSDERFERPIKDAYKICIHKSYRENGKVKKKQWVICTMGYYDIVANTSWAGDYLLQKKLDAKLDQIGITETELWDMVYLKLDPIIEQVKKEFELTEEYKTKAKHDEIINKYLSDKQEFEKEYGSDTYDYCYDIYGTLRNKAYLEEVKFQKTVREEYQKRSYERNYQSNYNSYNFGGYSVSNGSNYTDDEKGMLKKIYREASKKFHPDVTKDDGTMMKFLTKLKEQWGI